MAGDLNTDYIYCTGITFGTYTTKQIDPFTPYHKSKLETVNALEMTYLSGVTSDIQTQFSGIQTQFTALKTKASLVYENSVNDFINQSSPLTWDTLYNSSYEWNTTASTDSLLTSGDINKVGRYLVTFNVKVAKMRCLSKLLVKLLLEILVIRFNTVSVYGART